MNSDLDRARACCFTGHRILPEEELSRIAAKTALAVRNLILQQGVSRFYVGGAVGYDLLAAKELFELREAEFPDIRVILAYPFDGFIRSWSAAQKEEYQQLIPLYDEVVRVCDRSSRYAYLIRDRYLVDCSAYCIGYCTRDTGGTAYTLRYAAQQGLAIRNLAEPDEQ